MEGAASVGIINTPLGLLDLGFCADPGVAEGQIPPTPSLAPSLSSALGLRTEPCLDDDKFGQMGFQQRPNHQIGAAE